MRVSDRAMETRSCFEETPSHEEISASIDAAVLRMVTSCTQRSLEGNRELDAPKQAV